jgi:hypothetical protein
LVERNDLLVDNKQNVVMKLFGNISSKCFAVLLLICVSVSGAMAQGDSVLNKAGQRVDMATAMRSNGKIYVVVTVLSIILLGFFLYLIRLDRKISKLEKEI